MAPDGESEHVSTPHISDQQRGQVIIEFVGETVDIEPETQTDAKRLFADGLEHGLVKPRSLYRYAVACLYTAQRLHQTPPSLDKLAAVSPVEADEISRAFSRLNQEFELPVPILTPEHHLDSLADDLDVDETTVTVALDILATARDDGLVANRSPAGVAGGCLITAAEQIDGSVSQADVVDSVSVSRKTIHNRLQELRELSQVDQ